MSRKPLLSARVPEDKAEKVEQFAEERGISKSDAMRRLIDAGLEEAEGDDGADRSAAGRFDDLADLGGTLFLWLFVPTLLAWAAFGIVAALGGPLALLIALGVTAAVFGFGAFGALAFAWWNIGRLIGEQADLPALQRLRLSIGLASVAELEPEGG